MSMPGFNAPVSLYKSKGQYRATGARNARAIGNSVLLAQSPAFDPCAHCFSLPSPCLRARCACVCAGGDIIRVAPSRFFPCGFECV